MSDWPQNLSSNLVTHFGAEQPEFIENDGDYSDNMLVQLTYYYNYGYKWARLVQTSVDGTLSQMFPLAVTAACRYALPCPYVIVLFTMAPLIVASPHLAAYGPSLGPQKSGVPPSWQGGVPKPSWLVIAKLDARCKS